MDPTQAGQSNQNSNALAALAQFMQMFGRMQQQRQVQSPQVTPAKVTPLNAPVGASMPQPQAGPTSGGYQPPPFGAQMMDKLDPRGAATFSAVQGVSQLLQDFENRKQQKEHAEAANIAQNLMQAIESGDIKTQQDILNDKHATKVLNKVYKGWLTKAQEAQQPDEKPDPAVQGFEQGIRQHVQQKSQKQQPGVVNGYRMPQATPEQILKARQTQNAMTQANALSPDELRTQARRAAGIEATPTNLYSPDIQAKIAAAQAEYVKSQAEVQKASLDLQKSQVDYQAAQARGETSVQELQERLKADQEETKRAGLEADTARAKYQLALLGGKISPRMQAQLSVLKRAEGIAQNIVSGKGDTSTNTITALQNMLTMAGLPSLAKSLRPGHVFGIGKSKNEDIQSVLDGIKSYEKVFSSPSGQAPSDDDSSSFDNWSKQNPE